MIGDAKHYSAEFQKTAASLPGHEVAWIADWRAVALQRFVSLGFPSVKDEAWKYTNVRALAAQPMTAAYRDSKPAKVEARVPDAHLIVFVNGRHQPSLSKLGSLPEGVSIRSLAEVIQKDPESARAWLRQTDETRAFSALNGAFLQDGLMVQVDDDCQLKEPIEVVWLGDKADNTLISERLWVDLGRNSELTLVERFEGENGGSYWRNALAEIRIGENAKVRHVTCQTEGPEAQHFRQLRADLGRSARYESHVLAFGGAVGRDEIEVRFQGEGGESILNGLFVGHGKQHLDNRTLFDHAVPHCRSVELYKGILGGAATGVFDGKVLVRREAQKTDSSQTNKNLLLSREAEINTKPSLEIYADDVKCAHGATTGQLDANALFYLRARGVDKQRAEELLTAAFAHEVLDAVPVEGLAAHLDKHWLQNRLAGNK